MSQSDIDIQSNIEKLRDNLLDMSLRNNLLNFRPRKKNIEIVDEDVASLYNILVVNEHKMKFLSNETLDEDALLDKNILFTVVGFEYLQLKIHFNLYTCIYT